MPHTLVLRRLLAATTLAAAAAGSGAAESNCEAIRAGIDAKVRAAGVSAFTLAVVPAQASAPGKVVGRCELGAKKIVYAAQAASGGGAAPARTRDEKIITECKDGSVSVGGDCRTH